MMAIEGQDMLGDHPIEPGETRLTATPYVFAYGIDAEPFADTPITLTFEERKELAELLSGGPMMESVYAWMAKLNPKKYGRN